MALSWNRTPIAGGSVEVAEADVADGHVMFIRYYQTIFADCFEPVGAVCNLQTATLNGGLVCDPSYAQQLMDEAAAE